MTKIRHYKEGDEPVPGYRLTGFLGSGGFGEVWKARAPGGAEVALKVINLGMHGALKEFRSLKLVKGIRHPHLVPVLAIWLKNEQGEILQEDAFDAVVPESGRDVKGTLLSKTIDYTPRPEPAELVIAMGLGQQSLGNRLEECQNERSDGMPLDELLKYMEDAAEGIDYLNSPQHKLGSEIKAIQHCDIKPANILIVGNAAAVCDFGLARETDDARKTTLALSPVYASPEIIASNIPSRSTDQYSLAMTYLHLRTGRLPFPENATPHTVAQAHLNSRVDFSSLQPAERAVISHATARQPADRYPSTSAMVAALREACHPALAPKRRGAPWMTAAAVALVLMVSLGAVRYFVPEMFALGPQPLKLPDGFVADADSESVTLGARACPKRILCQLHGLSVPFCLVNGRRSGPCYIMETKVSNEVFGRFAEANPSYVVDSKWRLGARARVDDQRRNLGVEGRGQYPVFYVTCVEAGRCARWLGGQLPTVNQWDDAAARPLTPEADAAEAESGPFLPLKTDQPISEQIAVDRVTEGPLPNGAATHDVCSRWGCRDLAGNGREWTLTTKDSEEELSLDHPDELVDIILRGRSYGHPEPLRYGDFNDRTNREIQRIYDPSCDISFRVVVTFEDLQ